ncbi:hypothetical protein Dred_1418 [Desulforamulus reducens MI-1]|uniref:Uncharacterized protein n=2 Tax=Desulforamulus TaxID=2916693 RepID=A4J4E5_DESRM|nr:hypothetical protein Dred_1418 [Desulforamulus reducens MI-1]
MGIRCDWAIGYKDNDIFLKDKVHTIINFLQGVVHMAETSTEKYLMSYYASVNTAEQATRELQEAGFMLPYINDFTANYPTDIFNQSIHPDLSGGTLSDLEYNYSVPFALPKTQDQLEQAVKIIEKHGGML